MPAKAQQFVPKGMKRDYSDSKADPQFAFENHNIRITSRENSTLLSITNEKGNTPVVFSPDPYSVIRVQSSYDPARRSTHFRCRFDNNTPTTFDFVLTLEDGSTENLHTERSEDDSVFTIGTIQGRPAVKFVYVAP